MRNLINILLLFSFTSCFGQYSSVPPSCCDSSYAYTTAVYFDGVPNSNPNQYESRLALDTTNNQLYSYNETWSKVGQGFSVVSGVIYWTGEKWDVLNNGDHTSIGIDSVSTSNGIITIHFDKEYDSVISAFHDPDNILASYGLTFGGSYGLNKADISVFIPKSYDSWVTCSYNIGWSCSHAHGSVYTNPLVTSWDSVNSILEVSHSDFLMPVTDVKTLGTDFRAIEYNNTYYYNKTRFKLLNFDGTTHQVANGNRFMFKLSGRYDTNNTLNGSLNMVRVTNYGFLTGSSSGVYSNFQVLILVK